MLKYFEIYNVFYLWTRTTLEPHHCPLRHLSASTRLGVTVNVYAQSVHPVMTLPYHLPTVFCLFLWATRVVSAAATRSGESPLCSAKGRSPVKRGRKSGATASKASPLLCRVSLDFLCWWQLPWRSLLPPFGDCTSLSYTFSCGSRELWCCYCSILPCFCFYFCVLLSLNLFPLLH